jgi:hypothetical protein
MNSLLERQKTQSLSDERERTKERQHNAQIGENYRKFFADGSTPAVEHSETEKRYATLEEYNLLASKITVEQAEKEKQERIEATRREVLKNTSAISAAKGAATSEVLNSPTYLEAARIKGLGGVLEAPVPEENVKIDREEEDEKEAEDSAKVVQKSKETVAVSAEREYYLNLAKKYLAIFAVAFLVMMTVITVNSVILNGMDIELTTLQQTLQSVMDQVSELQSAIAAERDWSSILEFIERTGMVLAGS